MCLCKYKTKGITMVANLHHLAPQGRSKKTKKTFLPQEKAQLEKTKLKKNANFSTLLNEKIDKKQKTPKEIAQLPSKESLPTKLENKEEKNDSRIDFAQKAPKAKKPKFQEVQATPQELALIATAQTLAHKESAEFEDREKKLKSSKKSTHTQVRTAQQPSTQEQLSLHTLSKAKSQKPLAPLKEALQNPLPHQKNERKTLGDVAKLAQDLNLTKLHLEEENPQKLQKSMQTNKDQEAPSLANQMSKTPPLQTLLSKHQSQAHKIDEKSKNEAKQALHDERDSTLPQQPLPKDTKLKDIGLSELLKAMPKEKAQTSEEKATQEESKSEKTQDFSIGELKRETQFKIASNKETLTQFSQRIKEEVLNYKPPFTKLSMELNPAELGKLEITITKKGKELQINVNANNANALQAFMQNQNEFRSTLSNVGFNNVELNFSQGEGKGSGGHSQPQEQQKGNKNSLEETITEIPALASMEIKMIQYA